LNGLAIASLVLGIVGIFTCYVLLPSILAAVFGIVAMRQIDQRPHELSGRGLAIAGLVCGAAVVVAFVLALVFGEVRYDAPRLR
jgi:NADH:ubiquinone oxidoreductase subunit 4 (subunit M)